ncbi:uncharacterized protein LOC129456717 [Periophthalmus magnuspinnatus]|uniref:uncharacterized protein LOC129456717 n=1 Tax=Periophthalmus magnuspinnatus TaxID=409849 RepID=UPI002437173D|nr:uncharacterized protein LOC129456717 [Periophthalmus magnuspinnatus]
MSGKKKREIALFFAVIYMLTYDSCLSVSLGRQEYDPGTKTVQDLTAPQWIPLDPRGFKLLPETKITSANKLHKNGKAQLNLPHGHQLSASEEEALLRHFEESGVQLKSLSWTQGNVSKHQGSPTYKSPTYKSPTYESPTYKSGKGFQSDYTDFRPVQGEILGVPADTAHLSEWRAMRPLVHCDQNVMTFTASGAGFTDLFVGRDGGAPVSVFDLPPLCGFSVKTSWSELEMTVQYDACYIIQEGGSLVLNLEWRGRPLKLSCPIWRPKPMPTVYCSPYGMVVHIAGQMEDLPTFGFKVNGRWGPLLADECASLVKSQPGEFLFFISTTASCVVVDYGVHLWLVIDELEYTLSCPDFLPVPPPPPSEPQSPFFPEPVAPSFPPLQTPPFLDPSYLHPEFPQIHPPTPQPPHAPKPTVDSPPEPQPQLQSPAFPPYFAGDNIKPNIFPPLTAPLENPNLNTEHDPFTHPNVPVAQALSNMFNPFESFPKPTVSPTTTTQMPNLQLHYLNPPHFQLPYHLAPPETPTPSPTPHYIPPKMPELPVNFYFPPYTDVTSSSSNPYQFYHQTSVNAAAQSPTVTPSFPEPYLEHCVPYEGQSCSYYPNPHYPHYPHYHPPSPLPPVTPSVLPPRPAQHEVQHFCLRDRILVRLPFAHSDSIQVQDRADMWQFISQTPHFCGYDLHLPDSSGVILSARLPGCHTHLKPDSSTSLCLRFWDSSQSHFRTVDVLCPPQTVTPVSLTPAPPSPPPTPFTPGPPKPEVLCSPHHMTVIFPYGTGLELIVKDLNGNRINLQDIAKDCGYSTSLGKDGKLHLSLPLHFRCHMTLLGSTYVINMVYRTYHGTREEQFSCPRGVVPITNQECNLPFEQRLPCGPGSVSQPHCASMGCCFSTYPPACYYPMDECTADRHFVFSVPVSLTEPPLSLASLVAGGNSSCGPQKVTSDTAVFKIPMDACGARRMQVGNTLIYMLEVNNVVSSVSLNYGTITRDSPVRLLVECRFLPGSALTVSYMVKTPSLGPGVQTEGAFGVQLRIAKDSQYQSYHPQYHQPLQMLLGKPLYLEVRLLNSPDPSFVLLVHYCVAYPRSGKAVWVLLYNGCPNPLDPDPNQFVVSNPQVPARSQTRRFTISTFQFLPDGEFKDSNEEIYFMCSTEICSPRDGPCVEGCFGQ